MRRSRARRRRYLRCRFLSNAGRDRGRSRLSWWRGDPPPDGLLGSLESRDVLRHLLLLAGKLLLLSGKLIKLLLCGGKLLLFGGELLQVAAYDGKILRHCLKLLHHFRSRRGRKGCCLCDGHRLLDCRSGWRLTRRGSPLLRRPRADLAGRGPQTLRLGRDRHSDQSRHATTCKGEHRSPADRRFVAGEWILLETGRRRCDANGRLHAWQLSADVRFVPHVSHRLIRR